MRRLPFLTALLALALGACSGSHSSDPPPPGPPGSDAAPPPPPADGGPAPDGGPPLPPDAAPPPTDTAPPPPPPSELITLVEGDWELGRDEMEAYFCVRKTLTEDVWIREFHPISPLGTHHTVVSLSSGAPDGITRCGGLTNGPEMIYGSGVGTEPLILPDGLAVRIPAGQQIMMNLHLFKTTAERLRGTSGLQVRLADPAAVEDEADVVLAGTVSIDVPARSTATETGRCTFRQAATIFAASPHMHQLGTRMRVTAHRAGQEPLVLHDANYNFDDQRYRMVEPMIEMAAGDWLEVECTYDNPFDYDVGFGESTEEEMCFFTTYRFPAVADGSVACVF